MENKTFLSNEVDKVNIFRTVTTRETEGDTQLQHFCNLNINDGLQRTRKTGIICTIGM